MFYFWREVGRRMGIADPPESYEAFERFNLDYERQHFRYTDANRRVAERHHGHVRRLVPTPACPVGSPGDLRAIG